MNHKLGLFAQPGEQLPVSAQQWIQWFCSTEFLFLPNLNYCRHADKGGGVKNPKNLRAYLMEASFLWTYPFPTYDNCKPCHFGVPSTFQKRHWRARKLREPPRSLRDKSNVARTFEHCISQSNVSRIRDSEAWSSEVIEKIILIDTKRLLISWERSSQLILNYYARYCSLTARFT